MLSETGTTSAGDTEEPSTASAGDTEDPPTTSTGDTEDPTTTSTGDTEDPTTTGPPDGACEALASDVERDAPTTDADLLGDAAAAGHDFSWRFHHELGGSGNLVASPLSLRAAFATAYGGAVGQTRSQIGEVFGFDGIGDDGVHDAMNAIDVALNSRNLPEDDDFAAVELRLAQSFWIDERSEPGVSPAYLDLLQRSYGASLHLADMEGDPAGAIACINGWVADRTNDHVTDFLPPDGVTQDTVSVLVNALYLSAPWETPFDQDLTSSAPFTTGEGGSVDVDMMAAVTTVPYVDGVDFDAVDIPLRGGQLSLLVVLPDEGTFAAFEAAFDAAAYAELVDGLAPGTAELGLPKFSLRSQVPAGAALQALGVDDAFQLGIADFTEIVPGDGALHIHEVFHEATLAVDEGGLEGAAATAIVYGGSGTSTGPGEIDFEFRADRPFLAVVHDAGTEEILFVARVVDPTA